MIPALHHCDTRRGECPRQRRTVRRPWPPHALRPLAFEELEYRRCPSAAAGLAAAAQNLPVDPNISRAGQLQGAGAIELYQVPIDASGLLTAQVHAQGFDTRLSLLDGQGNMLIESEASTPQNPDDHVAMHLTAGEYFLLVQGSGGGGSFTLATNFVDANAPSSPLSAGTGSYAVAAMDLNGDKVPDVIVADFYANQVLIYLGLGDGTFQPPTALPVGLNPAFVTAADLTGNGIPDIITANLGSNDVSILLGKGARHLRARDRDSSGPRSIERGGRRLQRRRPSRPGGH